MIAKINGSVGLLLLLLCISCSKQTRVKDIIYNAENMIEQQPDSALCLLNSVLFPEDLSPSLFNKYNLLLIQAKDKSCKDITSDTVIFAVKDYYIHKKEDRNAALAAFYCARVLHEKNADNTMNAYIEAKELAEKTKDCNLKGLIHGNLAFFQWEHSLYDKAIASSKNAVELFDKAKNYKNKICMLELLGNCFLIDKQINSAFYYHNESLRMADSCNILEMQASVRQNMGVAYREKEHYGKAKELFKEALTFSTDSVEQARILLNIAQVYILDNKPDSVKTYLDKALALQVQDPWIMRTSYLLRSTIKEKSKNYREALKYYKEYHGYTYQVFDSEKNNKLLELQEKYDFEKIKNSNNQLTIKHQQIQFLLIFILLSTGLAIFIIYQKWVRKKKLLLEAESKIRGLQKMASEFSEEEQSLRFTIFQYFNVLRKVASLEKYLTEEECKTGQRLLKKFNMIVYEEDSMNWEKLFQVMDQYKNGFYNKVREKYTRLNDWEFRVCCLSCEPGLDDTEISIIIGKSIDMVRRLRSDIRKKLGMPAYNQDFYAFLSQKLSEK